MLFTRERLYYNVERLMTYKKKILSPYEESNLRPSKFYFSVKNITLSTLLILAVCRTRVISTS